MNNLTELIIIFENIRPIDNSLNMLAESINGLTKLENLCLDLTDSHPYNEDFFNFMLIIARLKYLRVLAVN